MLSAGLPHLLLSARHLPLETASLPMALRRAGMVAGAAGCCRAAGAAPLMLAV